MALNRTIRKQMTFFPNTALIIEKPGRIVLLLVEKNDKTKKKSFPLITIGERS
ncbi:MAG: hypothetical protein ETSY2_50955 [Candidatus Entotheonella gemina]|uniref:Uncharacterized protein n=1 Tax=Candidatus Entotheonella gemina TaxID=1429439 RepID=W4L7P6_9BACT|nr:MAG: hypothetical protein ETSY2_50955 [Candidatus Entotheonella gemina]